MHFETTLCYLAGSGLVRHTQKDPVSKNQVKILNRFLMHKDFSWLLFSKFPNQVRMNLVDTLNEIHR